MLVYLIPISLFLVVLVIFSFLQKDNYLEKMVWQPKEEILFEDPQCRFRSFVSRGRGTLYIWGHACITNQRILLAQRGLLGKKRVLRFVLPYQKTGVLSVENPSIWQALKTGHILFYTTKEKIRLGEEKGKPCVTIDPEQSTNSFFEVTQVIIYPSTLQGYRKYFG